MRVLHFHVYLKYAYCSCVRRGLEACLHFLLPILGFLWHDPFSGFSFFKACSFSRVGLCLAMGFSSFSPISCLFSQSLCVLPYCSAIPTVALFDPSLLGLFGLIAYFALRASLAQLPYLSSLGFMDFLSTPYFL